MSLPQLSEAALQRSATSKSFERGEAYYYEGAVRSLTLRGKTLLAAVEGSNVHPYHVSIQCEGGEVTDARCTCPYSFEGWCKHIVATLLTCLRQPAKIEERPTLEALLDRLNDVQTQRLIQELVAEYPELLDRIERLANRIAPPLLSKLPLESSQPPRPITIDTAPYRSQVRHILRDAVRYLEEGWEEDPVSEELLDLVGEAQMLVERGESHNAIAVLEAITAACAENWDEVDEYGIDNDEIADALDEIWTEAILSADLTPSEKVDLQVNLESWQDEWSASFAMSLEALRQGWDYPPLQRVLAGEISQLGAWEGEAPPYADDLALIRLKILEQQARYPEYLNLAQAEGQIQQYLTMLVRLDRIEEAMQAAQSEMESMQDAFALAQVLQERGAREQALQIAKQGLTLPGNRPYEFATWTSNLAQALGDTETALAAKVKAFQAKPSFLDYRQAEVLAGEAWTALKADLLDYLGSYRGWGTEEAKVEICLHENLIEEAIAVVSDLSSYQSSLIGRVMDAAIPDHADWAIANAKRRAEAIMDAKKAEHYIHAIEWLRKVRAAYCQTGRKAEWSTYRAKLMQTHARKYKLRAMLQQRDLD
jgi:uncharacterized Zn finger protein